MTPHAAEVGEVARGLGTDPERGLGVAEAAARLAEHGPNELQAGDPVRPGTILLGQLTSPMILLLAAAGVLSAALGDVTEPIVILVVVVLNAWIGFRQEYRAERAMASLQAMTAPTVRVVRDAMTSELPAREIVPGDVVLLEAGSRVPADGRLAEAHALRVEESALTGESVPVDKGVEPVVAAASLAGRTSMAYSGTSVSAGRGTLLVTATGTATELGHVAGLLEEADAGRTPLQMRLDTLVKGLTLAAGAIVLVVFGLGLLRGEDFDVLLLTAVSLAVAAIPESLPAVVTITLALGAQRMLERNALIRRLYAVETLGSVTTICSDKTGTLTQNRMTTVVLDMAGDRRDLHDDAGGSHHPDELRDQPTLRLLLVGGALCNDTAIADDGSLLGDPTETALVALAQRYGLDKDDLEAALPRVFELPFDSERKRMTTVHALPARAEQVPPALRAALADVRGQVGPPDHVAFTKGAVDGLLARCDAVSIDGEIVALDDDLRGRAREATDRLAAEGVRVLGVAMRRWPSADVLPRDEALERGLTFAGLEGMIDPARPEVREAIATCREAGMRAVMITGDHPLTAAAIARDLGLGDPEGRAVTGAELAELNDVELETVVSEASVYARVSPEHKIRIVEALQRQGHVVAMTGDGVNDAPALKQANIGVAMGITGTNVSKESAAIVLADDNFTSIAAAVEEGRRVYDNLIKSLAFVLPTNLGLALILICAVAFFPFDEVTRVIDGVALTARELLLPMAPVQLLWINLVAAVALALPLAFEAKEPDVMSRPPRNPGAPVLSGFVIMRTFVVAVLMTAGAIGLFLYEFQGAGGGGPEALAKAQTMAVTTVVMFQIFYLLSCRSLRYSVLEIGVFSNKFVFIGIVAVLALQAMFIYAPFMQAIFSSAPLAAVDILASILVGVVILPVIGLEKWWWRRTASETPRPNKDC